MIALYLIAAHMVGDFLFQTRWQAINKFTDAGARLRHVATYTLAFVPVVFAVASWHDALLFLMLLSAWHYVTDSRRLLSTLGDVLAWDGQNGELPPNPWPAMPVLIDQTLHIVQIAVFAAVVL